MSPSNALHADGPRVAGPTGEGGRWAAPNLHRTVMVPITRLQLTLAFMSVTACGLTPAADEHAHSAATQRSGEIQLARPTVVAFFDTSSRLSSDGDEGDALADFEYYAGAVSDTLRKLGVDFQVRYTASFDYRSGRVQGTYVVPTDSPSVGYVFLAPGRVPVASFGVMTDSDLVAWCRGLL